MPSTVSYAGLPSAVILSCSGTHCRGPHPTSFLLAMKPEEDSVPQTGDLVFTDTDSGQSITFKDCVVEKPWLKEYFGHDPMTVWYARILDRRVHWKNQFETYEANVRCPDGTIQPYTQKTAQAIATDLLTLMGESSIDVSEVPADVYPFVSFSGPPAFALDEMVRRLGGYIVLKNDDSVALCWPGNGTDVTTDAGAFTVYHNMAIEKPANVKVICGDTWWESMFELECVGLEEMDTSSDVLLLANLGYKPADWTKQWPAFFADVSEGDDRERALRSVYKWYRIVALAEGGLSPTDADEVVTAINQLLPLRALMCRSDDGDNLPNQQRESTCEVHGQWWPFSDHPYNTGECEKYPGSFDLEGDNGIVKFHDYVIKLDGGCPACADLHLWAAHRLRLSGLNYQRKEFTYAVTDGTGDDLEVYWPELFLVYQQVYANCASPSTETNLTDLTAEADAVGAALVAAIENRFDTKRLEYPLLQPTDLDGDIAQVSYFLNQWTHGTFPTRTVVSIGSEGDYHEQEDAAKSRAAQLAIAVAERMKGDTPRRAIIPVVR